MPDITRAVLNDNRAKDINPNKVINLIGEEAQLKRGLMVRPVIKFCSHDQCTTNYTSNYEYGQCGVGRFP